MPWRTPSRHFHAAGDIAGLTLTLYDLASVAVQNDDLPRAARLRGAARNLTTETGTGLATFTETAFEQAGLRPNVLQYMPEDEAERLGAEGAAMTLDEAVAYALEGSEAVRRGRRTARESAVDGGPLRLD